MDTLIGLALGFALATIVYLWRLNVAQKSHDREKKAAQASSVATSKEVTYGQIAERLAPYLPDYPYNPEDTYPAPAPLDLIVFNGLSAGDPVEIVFLEVKTGSSRLNDRQRDIKQAADEKRVRYDVYRPEAGRRSTLSRSALQQIKDTLRPVERDLLEEQ